ncbi:MAG: sigma-70 family RNA polymerase sigma factor, partial [Bacteroidota bacterium]
SWLFAVARNEILMTARRKKILSMERFEEDETVCDIISPLQFTINSELQEIIQQAIQLLKPAYREVYLLREIEGLSYEEIAKATESTVSAIKSKLFKARMALNDLLASYVKEKR